MSKNEMQGAYEIGETIKKSRDVTFWIGNVTRDARELVKRKWN